MVISPKMGEMALAGGGSAVYGAGGFDAAALVSAIRESLGDFGGNGDIVIPVYLGGVMLDEVIVNSQREDEFKERGR